MHDERHRHAHTADTSVDIDCNPLLHVTRLVEAQAAFAGTAAPRHREDHLLSLQMLQSRAAEGRKLAEAFIAFFRVFSLLQSR